MPTVYQRIQEYHKQPNAYQFGKKKTKIVGNILKKIYAKRETNPPLEYVESVEQSETYQVRNYPDLFISVIDSVIQWMGNKSQENIINKKIKEQEKINRELQKRLDHENRSKRKKMPKSYSTK